MNFFSQFTGLQVKCLLKNSTLIEGIVEVWNDQFVQLKSLDQENILFIHRPNEEIVFTKIIMVKNNINNKEDNENYKTVPLNQQSWSLKVFNHQKENLEQKFQEELVKPSSNLRIKTLADLKKELNKQDKKIIKEKLKEHQITDAPNRVEYFSFLKKR